MVGVLNEDTMMLKNVEGDEFLWSTFCHVLLYFTRPSEELLYWEQGLGV